MTMDSQPHQIGPYLIREKIGSGGFATVYRAYHPGAQREYALKVLAANKIAEGAVRRRFEREAQTLRQFAHPNILPMYDYGRDDTTLYIATRLMSGRTLKNLLTGHPLPTAEVASLTRQIASALDYAHARGIIHRDLKPPNILFDDLNRPFLADFGVAFITHVDATQGLSMEEIGRLTKQGEFVGTAAYASPEQCQGQSPVRASDIYSLAVMVFEMLTGKLPFEGANSFAVMMKHLREPPPNPIAYNPNLPGPLYTVLAKALAKLPQARYPSAQAFSDELDQALGFHVAQADAGDAWLYDDIRPITAEPLDFAASGDWLTAAAPPSPAPVTEAHTTSAAEVADWFANTDFDDIETEFDAEFDAQADFTPATNFEHYTTPAPIPPADNAPPIEHPRPAAQTPPPAPEANPAQPAAAWITAAVVIVVLITLAIVVLFALGAL